MTEENNNEKVEFDRIIQYMNEQRPETLILLAWHLFGVDKAVGAELISLDKIKFTLKIKSKTPFSKSETIKEYKFKTPLKSSQDSKNVLIQLHNKYSSPSFPVNPVSILTILLLWIGPLIAIAQPNEFVNFELFHTIRLALLKYIYRSSTIAAYVLAIVTFLHVAETVFLIYSLSHIALGPGALNIWIGLDLLLGYPITEKVLILTSVVKRKGRGKKTA